MADAHKRGQDEAIIVAARRYRDLMRRYMTEQAAMIDRGMSLDDLVASNWDGFAEVVAAEEALFAMLDSLDTDERKDWDGAVLRPEGDRADMCYSERVPIWITATRAYDFLGGVGFSSIFGAGVFIIGISHFANRSLVISFNLLALRYHDALRLSRRQPPSSVGCESDPCLSCPDHPIAIHTDPLPACTVTARAELVLSVN